MTYFKDKTTKNAQISACLSGGLFTPSQCLCCLCKEIKPQSILKQISHEYSLERLTLKMKRQHFDHLM